MSFESAHFTRYTWLNVAAIVALFAWIGICLAMGWV